GRRRSRRPAAVRLGSRTRLAATVEGRPCSLPSACDTAAGAALTRQAERFDAPIGTNTGKMGNQQECRGGKSQCARTGCLDRLKSEKCWPAAHGESEEMSNPSSILVRDKLSVNSRLIATDSDEPLPRRVYP